MPAGQRSEGGRRVYGDTAVRRLTFIRRCRDFGFSIEQVRELIGLVDHPNRPCTEVKEVAVRHLAQLRERLAELQSLEASMTAFVRSCDTACAGGTAMDCTILEDLSVPRDAAAIACKRPCCATQSA